MVGRGGATMAVCAGSAVGGRGLGVRVAVGGGATVGGVEEAGAQAWRKIESRIRNRSRRVM